MERDSGIVAALGAAALLTACAAPAPDPHGAWKPSDAPLQFSLFPAGSPDRIDAPCGTGGAPDVFGDRCGRAGRVSVEATERWSGGALPCEPGPVGAPSQGIAQGACVVGDEVVAGGQCMYCRTIDAGWMFHGRASALRPEQALALLARLGVAAPNGRAPASANEWRALFAR